MRLALLLPVAAVAPEFIRGGTEVGAPGIEIRGLERQ